MKAMTPIVTIIIPTYNRHRQLKRLLDYYSNINFPIIVGDSTATAFPNSSRYKNVKYLHFPDYTYAKKLPLIYKKVKTKYVLFCADDDFIIPNAISNSVKFLEKNRTYVSAHGHYVFFESNGRMNIKVYPFYLHSIDIDINSDKPSERVKQLLSNYMQLLYAVTKTSVVKEVFQQLEKNPGIKNDSLVELFQAIMVCINGKSKTLPIFYCAREVTPNSARTYIAALDVVSTNKKYSKEYNLWLKVILNYLLKKEGMPKAKAQNKLLEAIKLYLKDELLTLSFLNIYTLQLQRIVNKYSFGMAQKIYRFIIPSPDKENLKKHAFTKKGSETEFKKISYFIEKYSAV